MRQNDGNEKGTKRNGVGMVIIFDVFMLVCFFVACE